MAKHPGSIEKRGDGYRVRLCVAGERHYFTLTDRSLEEVKQFAREKDAELRRRNGRGLPGPMPFSELLARYREAGMTDLAENTRSTYTTSLDAFHTYFVRQGGDPAAHAIGRGHVRAFMTWRRTHSPD